MAADSTETAATTHREEGIEWERAKGDEWVGARVFGDDEERGRALIGVGEALDGRHGDGRRCCRAQTATARRRRR